LVAYYRRITDSPNVARWPRQVYNAGFISTNHDKACPRPVKSSQVIFKTAALHESAGATNMPRQSTFRKFSSIFKFSAENGTLCPNLGSRCDSLTVRQPDIKTLCFTDACSKARGIITFRSYVPGC